MARENTLSPWQITMTSSSSEPAPEGTSPRSAPPSSGKRVAIIEKKYWGGVCLNVGCIPSKALLRNAELAHIFTAQAKTFGISGDVSFDFGAAHSTAAARSPTAASRACTS